MTERLAAGDGSNQLVPAPVGALQPAADYGMVMEPEEPISAGHQIGRLISALLRYKWLILALTILGVVGSLVAIRFIRPEYRVSGTIYIKSNAKGGRGGGQILQEDSWLQLIKSFAVLDPVVLKTKLYLVAPPEDSSAFSGFEITDKTRFGRYTLRVDPNGRRFTLESGQGFVVDTGAVGDSIGVKVGFNWAPAASGLGRNREIAFEVRAPRDASIELLKTMQAGMPGRDGVFMAVGLTGIHRAQITRTLNTILEQFVWEADRLKKEELRQVIADLEKQLRNADSSMRVNETALEGYRVATITEPREDQFPLPAGLAQTQSLAMNNYYQKRTLLASIQKDRKAIEDLLKRGKEEGVIPIDAFHTIGAVRQAPGLTGVLQELAKADGEVRALRLRYTDEYRGIKDLLAQIDNLKANAVPEYAQRLVEQLKSQEAELEREVGVEGEELKKIPVRTLTEEKLRRDANSAIQLTQNLQNQLTNARLMELTATADVVILDPARLPARPSSNTKIKIMLYGVVGSLGFAMILAVLLDRIDKRFRYPEQATHDLKLTILGAVPVIRSERRGLRSPAETAQIVEALRSIRLNLAHSFPPAEPIVVTLTSPSPGDGKSLVAANLAMSFAEAGYRTLLIDGDTRRGEQYKTFQVDRRPGLLDYLELGLPVDGVIYPTQYQGLSVLPSGSRMARGPELLGSSRMTDLMASVRNQYQVILVDSPPLGAGVDAFVLGTATGSVAVILRTGETDRQLAHAKLQLMERLPTRLVGAILNHIQVGRGAYKYYAYEYTPEVEPVSEEPVGSEDRPLPAGR
jgi:capsular exopolysaccharide synthesis family protein